MKTILLCILSAVLAAGITYYITHKEPCCEVNPPQPPGFAPDDWKFSGPIDTGTASMMIDTFAGGKGFFIPTAWTFSAGHIKQLAATLDSTDRVKMYAGVKYTDKVKWMTLIVLGNKNGSDVTTTMFEYADPCPPLCGKCDPVLLSHKQCYARWVADTAGFKGKCEDYETFDPAVK